MSDAATAALLRSSEPLVVIEAGAGCGKTHQGADYAREVAAGDRKGRLLILTHTNAACDVFAHRVEGVGSRVDIRTIDRQIAQVAAAYHAPLGFPADPARWASRQENGGFDQLAQKVANYLEYHPMIADALARRYSTIICDEHQDCTLDQHRVVMAIHRAGAALRIFGDPLQRIYGGTSQNAVQTDWARWTELKDAGRSGALTTPHRWRTAGVGALGDWIMETRRTLEAGGQIDLTRQLPAELTVVRTRNVSQSRKAFALSPQHREPIDAMKNNCRRLLVLAPTNDLVGGLRAFWNRQIPIWEGHQRGAFSAYVDAIVAGQGDPHAVGAALVSFIEQVANGVSRSSHGDRLLREIDEGCAKRARGPKPANIQMLAHCLLDQPDHRGAASALRQLKEMAASREAGFDSAKIDMRSEFHDAIRLGGFSCAETGFEEITRKRTHARIKPPDKAISTIHKAKGLECDHVMLVMSAVSHLSSTLYSRNRLYVALSRARRSLTLALPDVAESPLFKLS